MLRFAPSVTNHGKATTPFSKFPTYMFVGLSPADAARAGERVRPIPVIKVAHVSAALERMLVTRPTVIVFPQDLPNAAALFASARDIGAELVRVDAELSDDTLSEQLETALRVGRERQK